MRLLCNIKNGWFDLNHFSMAGLAQTCWSVHLYGLAVNRMVSYKLCMEAQASNLFLAVPIFSSPEPLGSQGELIGWP